VNDTDLQTDVCYSNIVKDFTIKNKVPEMDS